MIDVKRVLIAGDWHGDAGWAQLVIKALRGLLPDEPTPVILQLGDFGLWPGGSGRAYLNAIEQGLRRVGGRLYFIHGNHDDHDRLDALAATEGTDHPVQITDHIFWLPVNSRWSWSGHTWVAVGGAASVDKALRLAHNWEWWPGELLTEKEAQTVIDAGHADVLVCHEAPSSVPIQYGPPSPAWALADLALSEAQRELLQRVVDEVQPTMLFHGHHHLFHCRYVAQDYGPMTALGLDMQASHGNLVTVDTEALEMVRVNPFGL